jgi:hypothetical protein
MEFRVGDLLIEEPPPSPTRHWKPRLGIAMQRVPDRLGCGYMAVLIDEVTTWVNPSDWRLAYPTEEKQWNSESATS